ncbi:dTDP-glucose 4,6-dehydratase [Geosporobacter ferrireducens]|uniref:dTDP-glucose 4,6-dehydratase n=1 Tax=Geosporobacter ferrireducens TaxID=1424294 RepID=A0A1D8GGI1_9FIRM|nr:dTDP-glucose 4,6-dehydratase [Geosporobacter ferrireducens]AOT70021.1 dTDP-glucose 4,6-dehydratase [Geosporobacter ferrireducens]MTI53434.1 dTDP-glucose 4,6-dehydratase [Geosporobacter ferrireducens]
MKTYLITGGAGFIGSNFIHHLFEQYKKDILVINLDALTYAGNIENLRDITKYENYKFIKGCICDKSIVNKIFETHDIDYIVNFAAESHVDRSVKDPTIFVKTNVLGVQVLLDIAKKYWTEENRFKKDKKFLQISTDEVYGSLGEVGFFTEKTSLDPHNPYAASKAGGDLLVKAYYDTYKMPVMISRCSNNYGPYQFPEKLIPLVIQNCLTGKKIPVYGDGKNIRDWLYVRDHCNALGIILEKGRAGEVYNIGGNNERQNIEVINTIIQFLQHLLPPRDIRRKRVSKELITYISDRKGHDRRYAINAEKIKRELAWFSSTDFDEGMKHTILWYLENENWLENIVNGEYATYYKKMYGNLL